MHLALKAYQELLLTVNEMDRSPDENIRHSANVIKSEITRQHLCLLFHHFSHIHFFFCPFVTMRISLLPLILLYLGNIFYLMEYREIFLTLLRKFDETKQPRSFLKDLVESTHLFLRMLERFCKGRNNLVVQVNRFTPHW